ncbi:hypothetical protein [Halomonas sp. Mc5H-6]|uniref:hypothetical protein n=1 Tax=Halomonas sp. Mc5H-6 TaxID=2954500 RepID=UPI0020983971|nr:hypothetical protein [Halomonas sp. Mc5H-6]MCO7246364.1 hypothetical protein [Halomonas sp. Mc5H-6]
MKNKENTVSNAGEDPQSSEQDNIQQLIIAIKDQTQAISDLAESNRMLVDYLIQDQSEKSDTDIASNYLDPDEED